MEHVGIIGSPERSNHYCARTIPCAKAQKPNTLDSQIALRCSRRFIMPPRIRLVAASLPLLSLSSPIHGGAQTPAAPPMVVQAPFISVGAGNIVSGASSTSKAMGCTGYANASGSNYGGSPSPVEWRPFAAYSGPRGADMAVGVWDVDRSL